MANRLKYFLFPFSVIYGGVVWLRNKFYDKKIFRSAAFSLPVICVGNLSVGGTGKTPMIEYLITLLKPHYHIATLSRGYKRKSKGFVIATSQSTPSQLGDEPFQMHKKFQDVTVAVAKDRVLAIPAILQEKPETEVILLDDAFQHRAVTAGFNILLTDRNRLFTEDLMLPAGQLRDQKSSSKRADVIVVTKAEKNLSKEASENITKKISKNNTPVFFTALRYSEPYHIIDNKNAGSIKNKKILLIAGIANPRPLISYLNLHTAGVSALNYQDHHHYTASDINTIKATFDKIPQTEKLILTTEKDAVKLAMFHNEIKDLPLFVIAAAHEFLFNEGEKFDQLILGFVQNFEEKV